MAVFDINLCTASIYIQLVTKVTYMRGSKVAARQW